MAKNDDQNASNGDELPFIACVGFRVTGTENEDDLASQTSDPALKTRCCSRDEPAACRSRPDSRRPPDPMRQTPSFCPSRPACGSTLDPDGEEPAGHGSGRPAGRTRSWRSPCRRSGWCHQHFGPIRDTVI
jgi:hypothetical protein